MKKLHWMWLAVPVALAFALVPASARASTPGCTNGAYFGYCATQVNALASPLAFDNFRQSTAFDNPIVGWTNSDTDPATDFFQLDYAGDPAQGVMFIWAPTGIPLDLCASDIYPGQVRLRPCTGSLWQRWVATQVGSTGFYTWTSKGSGRIIQSNGRGNVLTTVPTPKTPTAAQEWKFST
jgi:hypothetical protein